jgi:hypothetical protein
MDPACSLFGSSGIRVSLNRHQFTNHLEALAAGDYEFFSGGARPQYRRYHERDRRSDQNLFGPIETPISDANIFRMVCISRASCSAKGLNPDRRRCLEYDRRSRVPDER